MLLLVNLQVAKQSLLMVVTTERGKVVWNYLKGLGFQTIDYMIATHPDAYNLFSKSVDYAL